MNLIQKGRAIRRVILPPLGNVRKKKEKEYLNFLQKHSKAPSVLSVLTQETWPSLQVLIFVSYKDADKGMQSKPLRTSIPFKLAIGRENEHCCAKQCFHSTI